MLLQADHHRNSRPPARRTNRQRRKELRRTGEIRWGFADRRIMSRDKTRDHRRLRVPRHPPQDPHRSGPWPRDHRRLRPHEVTDTLGPRITNFLCDADERARAAELEL